MNTLQPDTTKGQPLPRWVTWADTATVVLFALAWAVAEMGGHRVHIEGLTLSIRSWTRLLGAALVTTVVRHALVKQAPLQTRAWSLIRVALNDVAVRAAMGPFFGTRAAVLIAGYLAVVLIGYQSAALPFRVSFNEFVNLPARWDAQWYLRIARDGYSWNGNPHIMQTVVFFPALPVLMHVGAFFTGTLIHGGLLIALAAFLGALIYCFRLAEPLVGERAARTTLWLLSSYPFAVYFSAPYTESLYLLAAAGAFFHLSRDEWRASAAWALFIGFCRPNGFFIAAPIAIAIGVRAWRGRAMRWRDAVPVMAPLVGPLVFSAFLYRQFGDPTAWLEGQAAWGRAYSGPVASVVDLAADRFALLTTVGLYRYTLGQPFDFLHSLAAVFVIASLWLVWRRLGAAYTAFVLVNVLPPLMSGSTMSLGRMTSVLFPTFIGVATIIPQRHVTTVVAFSCMLEGVMAAAFFTWRDAY